MLADLDYCPLTLRTHPAAPLDSWRLARALGNLTEHDLFFSPGYNTPLFCPSPFVFAIHDLSHIHCRENSSPLIRLYYATVLKRACRRAASILTVSEFTRTQIAGIVRSAAEKVYNVSCGVDPEVSSGGVIPTAFHFRIFCASPTASATKTSSGWWKLLLGLALRLKFHWSSLATAHPELAGCIERHRVTSRVHFTGLVPEAKLPSLYQGAEALVFPSLYEGFGLPLVEAMACGTPVLTSNITAMPETAGDAALLVDPTSVEQIAAATEKIVNDTSLRGQLREKGLARAAQFSWFSTAARVHELLTRNRVYPT